VLAATSDNDSEASFITLLNTMRSIPVGFKASNNEIASRRAADMLSYEYYAHTNPITGAKFSDLLAAGTGYACENLLLSYNTDSDLVLKEWLNSTSHRSCLQHADITAVGFHTAQYDEIGGKQLYLHVFIGSER
jgi:uncharacterized protein YkwD